MGPSDAIVEALLRGHLDLAQVGGFTDDELAGAQEAARVYLARGQPAKALRIAGLLVSMRPVDGVNYRIAGIAAHELGQTTLAASLLTMALERNPDDLLARELLAELAPLSDSSRRMQ